MKYALRPIITCAVGLISLALQPGSWAAAEDCAKIVDPVARLACFDKRFPAAPAAAPDQNDAPTEEAAAPDARTLEAAEADVEEDLETAPIRAESGTTQAATSKSQRQSPMFNSGGMFERRNKLVIESTVKSVLNKNQKKMMFLLDNEQVWMQTSPRNLPIREGQKVTIKSGTVGGFILATERGTTTRVRRIK